MQKMKIQGYALSERHCWAKLQVREGVGTYQEKTAASGHRGAEVPGDTGGQGSGWAGLGWVRSLVPHGVVGGSPGRSEDMLQR